MRTAQEMDAYAKSNGYIYIGGTALKHFSVIEKVLLPDEDVIVALAPNSVYNGSEIVMGGVTALVFTNKRLIYGQKALLMGTPTKIVNLENINDVEKDTFGIMNGKIYIDTLKERIGFKFQKEVIDRMFPVLVQLLENYKKSSQQTISVDALSPADELKKFKELFDIGVITQEEFEEKKKQLLGL